jgi:hypothetical protein
MSGLLDNGESRPKDAMGGAGHIQTVNAVSIVENKRN